MYREHTLYQRCSKISKQLTRDVTVLATWLCVGKRVFKIGCYCGVCLQRGLWYTTMFFINDFVLIKVNANIYTMKKTIAGAASDQNFIKIKKFPIHCSSWYNIITLQKKYMHIISFSLPVMVIYWVYFVQTSKSYTLHHNPCCAGYSMGMVLHE